MMHTLKSFRLGTVKPVGWMKKYLRKDLEEGFIGSLDELAPDIFINNDIYGADRIGADSVIPELGIAFTADAAEYCEQYKWWNSESQSNWLDGLYRTALLAENQDYLKKARDIVNSRLSLQEPDGYLGIYKAGSRFTVGSENGELWAQSTLLRAVFAHYEATGSTEVLSALERAVRAVMNAWKIGESSPFGVPGGDKGTCGLCHGLTFTDTLENLFLTTGNREYLDYALFLFDDYCKYNLSEPDIRVKNLLSGKEFVGHAAHTYEHLRILALAAACGNKEKYQTALRSYLARLKKHLLPSGAPIGDEWIGGRTADAARTGYEYCSLHELLHSYTSLLRLTGDFSYADSAEWLLYNAAMGARNPENATAAYLNTDTALRMTGDFRFGGDSEENKRQTRYKYSPVHQDVAVCCIPNAGRIFPYFIQSGWYSRGDTLVKALYFPGIFEDGGLKILEETEYPFGNSVKFTFHCESPVKKTIKFRKPAFADDVIISQNAVIAEEDSDYITVGGVWKDGDVLELRFEFSPRLRQAENGEYFFSFGPLLMVLPIEYTETKGREYSKEGFADYYYTPVQGREYELRIPAEPHMIRVEEAEKHGFILKTALLDSAGGEREITLVPIANTILRRAAFPLNTITPDTSNP